MLFLSMGMVGIAWSSILAMPYSMLAGCIPEEKVGIYMGIFNFFIVLPEILASLFFGKIMSDYLHNDRLMAVLIGGFLLIAAGVVCFFIIKENKNK
jgi:maltose/moltooligosaccharide transporter